MAHLLAISDLHIGLIYRILLGLLQGLGRLSIRFMEHLIFMLSSSWSPFPEFGFICCWLGCLLLNPVQCLCWAYSLSDVYSVKFISLFTPYFLQYFSSFSWIRLWFTKFFFNSHFSQFYLFYGFSHLIHILEKMTFSGNVSLNMDWSASQ